jgi:excisionase family DNA binding protein
MDSQITNGHSFLEPYVSPEKAAEFLCLDRLRVIRLARAGKIPAHPLGTSRRRQWRFKLSELERHMQGDINGTQPPVRQERKQ